MDRHQLQAFCAALPGTTTRLYDDARNVLVFSLDGKQFAYFKTSEPERWRFSFRVSPDRFLELTDVPGIKPARWMARFHWVTVVDVRSVPDDYLTELVTWSYRWALGTLSKAKQARLLQADGAAG